MSNPLAAELEERGIVVLRDLLTQEQLGGMQKAFEVCLRRMRWNNFDGFEKTESYRHMVQGRPDAGPGLRGARSSSSGQMPSCRIAVSTAVRRGDGQRVAASS